jgi:hypothetical protein
MNATAGVSPSSVVGEICITPELVQITSKAWDVIRGDANAVKTANANHASMKLASRLALRSFAMGLLCRMAAPHDKED